MGVPIEENKFLFSLNYADDQVTIAQDAEDLEFILKRLNRHIKKVAQQLILTKQNL